MWDVVIGRVGLRSVLFLRDLNPLKPSEITGLSGGRVGEGSRDDLGELKAEEGWDRRDVVDARVSGGGETVDCGASFVSASTFSLVLTGSVFASSSPLLEALGFSPGNAIFQGGTFVTGPRQYW